MKVALVHDFLTSWGGAERVLKVIGALFPGAPIFTLTADREVTAHFADHPIIAAKSKKSLLDLWRYPIAIERFDLSNFDLVISSSNSFAHGVITRPETLHLCYCHSPARFLWDYHHQYLEERRWTGWRSAPATTLSTFLRLWDASAADRPDCYLANSQTVASRIEKYYRRRATVLYPPVELNRFSPSQRTDDYYLMVTRLSEYKKVDVAISAFNQNGRRLTIVGTGRDERRLRSFIRTKRIELLGLQSDQSVATLYRHARALIHPQIEDFGLTVVEALASGCPVIAFAQGGAAEVLTDRRHGRLFRSQTADSLNQAIEDLDHLNIKTSWLTKRAADFSVDRFTDQLTKVIAQLQQTKR